LRVTMKGICSAAASSAVPGSAEVLDLERRADDAAALQIPFIVTLNRLLEEYYELRHRLERRLQGV